MTTFKRDTSASRFQKGSAVFVCGCCNRRTRATGRRDNENNGLCAQCYDLAGESNSLADTGALYDAQWARQCLADLADKGIDTAELFPDVVAALAKAGA
jgi:hypothetical protein